MRPLAILAAALLLCGTTALAQPPAAAPSAGPMVRANATQRLTDHVYAIPDNSVPGVPNVGIIVGNAGVLVVDTGMGAPNARTILAEVQKVAAGKKLYLVTTHVHPEHDLGAHAFPADTTMIRANAQVREIAQAGMTTADAFRGRSEINRQLLDGATFRTANVTFDGTYDLDLGGVRVRLIALGTNHTPGDTAIFVEGDRVLFSGDVAMRALPAASASSTMATWLASLDRFDALAPRIIVPSHGPIGDLAYVANYRKYLTLIRDGAVKAKRAGKTADETLPIVNAALTAGGFDTARAANAIRAAYAEAR